MKKLILAVLMLFSITVSAQSIGALIQPDLHYSTLRKGVYVESTIYKSLGLYSDYKFNNKYYETYDVFRNQVNLGLSYKIYNNLKVFGSTDIYNNIKITQILKNKTPYNDIILVNNIKEYRFYQVGLLYSVNNISLLAGYETGGHKLTLGLGLNLF